MDQVKTKTLAEGIARSLRRMRADNACPLLHNAARLTRPLSTASLSRRDSEGNTMKSRARKTLKDSNKITERREVDLSKTRSAEPAKTGDQRTAPNERQK